MIEQLKTSAKKPTNKFVNSKRSYLKSQARLVMYFLNSFVGKEIFSDLAAFEDALERFDNISLLFSWFKDPLNAGYPRVTITYYLYDKYRKYD
jgi:hypothetical protein